MKRVFFFVFLFGAFLFRVSAQDESVVEEGAVTASKDTVLFLSDFSEPFSKNKSGKITDNRLFRMGKVPVSLFVLSGLVYPVEYYIYEVRNYQVPNFNYSYDDYILFAPGVAVFGLKMAGVEGYSDWNRLMTSTAISGVVTVGMFSGLKYLIDKERPDASNLNSFPSGHTASAFMTATWLHKEYGLTRSPLYSIAGYSVATLVGLTRQLNNKHWFSDVLFGAGIGYLGVEVGYWASDLIFKDKGIITPYTKRAFVDLKQSKPSFISLNMGHIISNGVDLTDDIQFENQGGYSIAVEGAWFINPNLGFGGKLSSNTINLIFDKEQYFDLHPEDKTRIKNIDEYFSGIYSVNAGTYFAYPLSDRFTFGSKLLGGITGTSSADLIFDMHPTVEYTDGHQVRYLTGHSDASWSLETGLSATVLLSRNLGIRFFADYLFSGAKITFKKNQGVNEDAPFKLKGGNIHNLVTGVSVNAYLF